MPRPPERPERSTAMTEELLRSLFETATRDLRAPKARLRPGPAVVPLPGRLPPAPRSRPRRLLVVGAAAVAGAAAAVVVMLGFGLGAPSGDHPGGVATAGPASPAVAPTGSAVLYRLASTVRALPTPTGRYAVQIERQSEGPVSYLKATVIDSRTGDTWTYQQGGGVPAVLPMAPGFSPTEAQLQASDPVDPARLRLALIAQASTTNSHPVAPQSPNDLAVTRAVHTLWNPLVQPALRASLVAVIASSPGVTTNPHATDSDGRKSIEVSYDDTGLGVRLSIYLDPSTGAVLESSERPYTAGADPNLAGRDVYLSQYWTDASPTVNPLKR